MMLLLLGACYPEPTFRDDLDSEICWWKAACYQDDAALCLAAAQAAQSEVDASCAYDAGHAHDCVTGVRQMECPGGLDTGGEESAEFGFPSACDRVWECP